MEEQQVLSQDLRDKIEQAADLTILEDLYLPFKKSKKTKAETARKNGLEPLAKIIMAQRHDEIEFEASKYLGHGVKNEDQALEGARHIIAEWINERTDIRNLLRYQLERFAQLTTKAISNKKKDASTELGTSEKAQKFRDYFDWSEPLSKCPSHRFLAILRAESEGFIRIKIVIDDERAFDKIERRIIKTNNSCAPHIKLAIKDSYKRLLFPSLSNELLKKAKEKADDSAIQVFFKKPKTTFVGCPLR